MAKKVRDVMTAEPRSAEPTVSLVEAARLMKSEDVGSLPIVEEGRLLAVLTDRDIVVRAVAEGVDANTTVIGDVASRELVTVEPEQNLDEALMLMAQHRFSAEWSSVLFGRRLRYGVGNRLGGRLGHWIRSWWRRLDDVADAGRVQRHGDLVPLGFDICSTTSPACFAFAS